MSQRESPDHNTESDVRIECIDAGAPDSAYSCYQQYVDRHPDGTLFHGLAWKQAVERSFPHRPHYLIARRAAAIVGVLPLFEINSIFAGRLLLSMPYATYGGVLADDDESVTALLGRARALAMHCDARCVELRSMRAVDVWTPVRRTHVTFRRDLPADPNELPARFPRKARAAARRAAERHALDVTFGAGQLKPLWRLYARSMRRLGSPNYPFRFFKELARATGDDHCVQLIRHRGRPVAGLMTFVHRGTAMPYFVGIDERADLYGLNNFLYLESMAWAVRRGCRVYDFGRTRIDNTGSFEFKRSFGFEPRTLEYQTIVTPGQEAPDLSPSSSRWSAARRLWKSLPLTMTKPLGGWLARSIPG